MSSRVVDWALAARPAVGESECGDAAFVQEGERRALAAAVDALGHGPEAARVARVAVDALSDGAATGLKSAAELCHHALRGTRGAAVTLAAFDAESDVMTWLGIGNVEGRLLRAGSARAVDSLLLRAGIAGEDLPGQPPTATHLRRGDLLVLATDGVAPSFGDDLAADHSCDEIAHTLLEQHAMDDDDALVLVVRYLGGGQ
jgi:phosphoserine phosphatase RsbX